MKLKKKSSNLKKETYNLNLTPHVYDCMYIYTCVYGT